MEDFFTEEKGSGGNDFSVFNCFCLRGLIVVGRYKAVNKK
jgi:hypothetical protein